MKAMRVRQLLLALCAGSHAFSRGYIPRAPVAHRGVTSRGLGVLKASAATSGGVLRRVLETPATPLSVSELCDLENDIARDVSMGEVERKASLFAVQMRRRMVLEKLLATDRRSYLETVNFLGARIPRSELPNRQGVPMQPQTPPTASTTAPPPLVPQKVHSFEGGELVPDCTLENATYAQNSFDDALLWVFRRKVQQEIGFKSDARGIGGLLEEGRTYMLAEEGTPHAQQRMVINTLGFLMTPLLPPFYRLFMSGLVPSIERGDPEWLVNAFAWVRERLPESLQDKAAPGAQLGPWFYAPALTSLVTPTFFGFLVGPSSVNRRKDGQLGGLVVEKCKFLQESGCKGLCLNQCKLPAQRFFQEELGLPLTVVPNFETQECQWSFGETPTPPSEDPSWPNGCIVGCPTRAEVAERKIQLVCE